MEEARKSFITYWNCIKSIQASQKKLLTPKNRYKIKWAEKTYQNWAETNCPWNRTETTQTETTQPKGNMTETPRGLSGNRIKTTCYRHVYFQEFPFVF